VMTTQMAKRILIVEDGGDLRATFVAVLTRVGGYETIEAVNGREAVEKAFSEKPDLILMDVDLPDISGIDAARAVKSNPRAAHIPIIAQTGWGSSRWQAAALAAGIVAYLQKPASMELIISTIERFL
jgi:two-component system, cell cycle response regulator DivK